MAVKRLAAHAQLIGNRRNAPETQMPDENRFDLISFVDYHSG
jgi:hypothetical protein